MRPTLIVCLGATAVAGFLGGAAKVGTHRGRVVESPHGACLVTTHPSSVLRGEGEVEREAAYAMLLADLRVALEYLQRIPA